MNKQFKLKKKIVLSRYLQKLFKHKNTKKSTTISFITRIFIKINKETHSKS